jgi:hypothetical protein
MKHFSESKLLDAAEGRLAVDRQRHAGECVACARQVDDLRSVLTRAVEAEVPEPSPLFWNHLSARVRGEIAHEAPSRWGWASGLQRWPLAATAAASVIALLVTVSVFRSASNGPSAGTDQLDIASARPNAVPPADADGDADDVEGDEAWAVVRAVADDAVWDDVADADISARPGSAERAVQTLTAAERTELAALIAEELKRSGA